MNINLIAWEPEDYEAIIKYLTLCTKQNPKCQTCIHYENNSCPIAIHCFINGQSLFSQTLESLLSKS